MSKNIAPATITADTEVDWRAVLVEALEAPGALGRTYTRFYPYSFLNQIRFLAQGINEPVATYKRWQELGFQVQEGTEAKWVLAPKMVSVTVKKDGVVQLDAKGKPRKRQVCVGFKYRKTVHPFSNTDGKVLPEIELPDWDTDRALAELGIEREPFAHTDGNVQGYSYEADGKKAIAINPAAAFPQKTLLHELAHVALRHTAKAEDGADMHRGLAEFEAETTAYLVAKELELVDWNPAESRAYIQNWLANAGHDPEGSNGSAFDEKNIQRIFGAVNRILLAGRAAKSEADEAAA